MIKQKLEKLILRAINKKFGVIKPSVFSVEIPTNAGHGDYSTNTAFVLAGVLKKSPHDLAVELAAELNRESMFKKVEVAGAGFINFWLKSSVLQGEFAEILKKKNKYGMGIKKKEKIQVEFISANPTGPMHIGHGRGAFLGGALTNLFSFAGYPTTREFYINDAKASAQIRELGKTALGEGTAYLTESLKKKINKFQGRIKKMEAAEAGYLLAREIQKENRAFVEKKLKIKFDSWLSEESLYKNGWIKRAADLLKKKDAIYQKDGALWLKTSAVGDSEDRVLIRSGGEPTYFYSDLAAHLNKLSRGFNKIIYIWGADHHGHVARTRYAFRLLGINEKKFDFIITQIVRLTRGEKEFKMSKRKGQYVTLEKLVGEVGLDAARYFFLEKSPNTHMDFDLDLAKERSIKNPVYYIQYAHARIASILRKIRNPKSEIQNKFKIQNLQILNSEEEAVLIKKLIQFPEVIDDIVRDYQVHRLTRYSSELAHAFHNFYEKQRVATENKDLTASRLLLVKAAQIVLRNSLVLLGISAPERM